MSEEAQAPAVEEQVEAPAELSAEDVAREGGWRPKDDWEGDPDLWVNAAQFNMRGQLMNRIKTQSKQLHKQESEISTLKQGFQEFQTHAKKLAENEYKQQIAQLKDVKKQALEDNDYDAVVEVDERMADLKESKKEEATQPPPEEPEYVPEVMDWVAENPWYEDDKVMQGAADAMAAQVRAENPEASPRAILDETAKRVKARFQTKNQERVNPMTASTNTGRPAKKAYGKSDLNEEQLKIGQRFVKAGAVESLKVYAAQLAEIGEIQR